MANKENIRKWVDALRSGEFKQVQRYLNKGDAYCCLGVACELAIADGVGVLKTSLIHGDGTDYAHYDASGAYLPAKVRKWLGIEQGDPFIAEKRDEHGAIRRTASDLNDRDGKTFAEIADAIETTYQLVDA